jgi:hypothetical protein
MSSECDGPTMMMFKANDVHATSLYASKGHAVKSYGLLASCSFQISDLDISTTIMRNNVKLARGAVFGPADSSAKILTTLLPFLYQTETIQRRRFSRSRQAQDGNQEIEPSSKGPASFNDAGQKFFIRRTAGHRTHTSEEQFQAEKDAGLIGKSRRYEAQLNRRRENAMLEQYKHKQARQTKQQHKSPQSPEHDRYFAKEPTAQELPPPERPKKDTTITEIEKHAFDRLFASLAKEAQQQEAAGIQDDAEDAVTLVEEVEDIEERKGDHYDVDEIINRELKAAAPKIEQYPSMLRKMAVDALYKVERVRAARDRRTALKSSDPVTARAQSIMQRIAVKLKAARTDIELWKVLEKEIFSQVRRIDISEKVPKRRQKLNKDLEAIEDSTMDAAQLNDVRLAKAKINDRASEGDKTPAESRRTLGNMTEPERPTLPTPETATKTLKPMNDLSVLRRTYPAALLLATRILAKRNQYTPLLSSLIPTLRSLHPYSLILGSSTALYNELLSNTWTTTTSLTAVLALLNDMSNMSLTVDIKTWEILEQITVFRFRALRGDYGEGLKAVEGMQSRMAQGQSIWAQKERMKQLLEDTAMRRAQAGQVASASPTTESRPNIVYQ